MRWFANEEVSRSLSISLAPAIHPREHQLTLARAIRQLPARPDNFLDAFYLSRDDTRAVQPTA
jgi:hypothetical protein